MAKDKAKNLVIDEKAKTITITIPLRKHLSKSTKSHTLGTTNGNVPFAVEFEGETVVCGVNCYIRNKDYVKPPKV